MTVDELRILKEELDQQIANLVADFELKTSARVDSFEVITKDIIPRRQGLRYVKAIISKLTFE